MVGPQTALPLHKEKASGITLTDNMPRFSVSQSLPPYISLWLSSSLHGTGFEVASGEHSSEKETYQADTIPGCRLQMPMSRHL
jgi:hypothetical protein